MMSSKRRTDLKFWPSEAKYLRESDFDVKTSLAPLKSAENDEKSISKTEKKNPKKKSKKKIRRQKIENRKSSETCFAEVSRRSEPCSKEKRTFEVGRRLGGICEA